ncbi:MAG: GGDEF domain-containing protein, partial [Limnothrix sp. CACIAM 69d]
MRVGSAIISRSTGDLVIPVSRRINNPDGTFAGVALITLKVDYFTKYFQRFSIGDDGNITLAYNDGTIMARRPEVAGAIGSSIYNGVIFSQLLPKSPMGTALFKSTVDGVERVYSYNAFPELPIVAIAGVDLKTILRPWWAQVIASSIVSIAIFMGLLVFFAALRREINRSLAVELELERVSLQDPLTGLSNRRNFNQTLRQEMNRVARSNQPLALLMLDIDYFKRFNDEYGHVEGDRCIQAIARALAESARRQEDLAARYGGEELVMLLPGCGPAEAEQVAERVRERIWNLEIA